MALTALIGTSMKFEGRFILQTQSNGPVNMLVVGPGNYGFGDFLRIGTPLLLITLAVAVLLVPLLFPFAPVPG